MISLPAVESTLRLPSVLKLVPVSKSTWYRGMDAGIYPRPVKIGPRCVAWKLSEIQACLAQLENSPSV